MGRESKRGNAFGRIKTDKIIGINNLWTISISGQTCADLESLKKPGVTNNNKKRRNVVK